MLKHITTLLLLAGLVACPATAYGDNPGGGDGGNYKYGYVRVTNLCDDAVMVNVGGWFMFLEPLSSQTVSIVIKGKTTTIDVTANLVADPAIQATKSAKVEVDKETTATVTATTSGGQTTLSIEIVEPTKPKGKK